MTALLIGYARCSTDQQDLTARQVRLNLGGSVYDPNDAVGRLMFNVLAMVAEFSVIWTRRDARLPDVRVAA
jgi:DNA invertase Pin-like site-specific DNA recombinase